MEPAAVVALSVERTFSAVAGVEYVLQVAHADAAGVSQVARFRLLPVQVASLIRLCTAAQR